MINTKCAYSHVSIGGVSFGSFSCFTCLSPRLVATLSLLYHHKERRLCSAFAFQLNIEINIALIIEVNVVLCTRTCKSLVFRCESIYANVARNRWLDEHSPRRTKISRFLDFFFFFLSITTNRQLRTKWLGQPLLGIAAPYVRCYGVVQSMIQYVRSTVTHRR